MKNYVDKLQRFHDTHHSIETIFGSDRFTIYA